MAQIKHGDVVVGLFHIEPLKGLYGLNVSIFPSGHLGRKERDADSEHAR
jgi:hypothetical protein